jgi:hypothetical protein
MSFVTTDPEARAVLADTLWDIGSTMNAGDAAAATPNSARIYAGPGSRSVLTVAGAGDNLAAGFRGLRLRIGHHRAGRQTMARSGDGRRTEGHALRGPDEREGRASRAGRRMGRAGSA